jgi:hypothetical protein
VKASSSGCGPIILTPNETHVMLNDLPLLQQTMTVLDAAKGIRYGELASFSGKMWIGKTTVIVDH